MADGRTDSPNSDSAWRSIILFGRNVASYKFALAKALIQLSEEKKTFVTLDQLAAPFSKAICDHLNLSDKQATSQSSNFLDACRAFNKGELDQDQLVTETVRRGFNNVIDAFHIVNQGEIPVRFYTDDRASKNGITLGSEPNHRIA